MDPIAEIVGAPKDTPRVAKWIEKGVAKNPTQAKRRIAASRATRRPVSGKTAITTSLSYKWARAIEMLSDRFDVPRAAILKRFIEDGIRKYGDEREKEAAGLAESRKPNPFDGFAQGAPMPEPVYPHGTVYSIEQPPAPMQIPWRTTTGAPLNGDDLSAPRTNASIEDDDA